MALFKTRPFPRLNAFDLSILILGLSSPYLSSLIGMTVFKPSFAPDSSTRISRFPLFILAAEIDMGASGIAIPAARKFMRSLLFISFPFLFQVKYWIRKNIT